MSSLCKCSSMGYIIDPLKNTVECVCYLHDKFQFLHTANSELFPSNCSVGLDSGRVGCQLFGWLKVRWPEFSLYNTTTATQNIFGVEYKSWSPSFCNSGHPPVTSPFFGWSTFLSTLFLNMMWDYGQNDTRHSPDLIFCYSSLIQFRFVSFSPTYLNFATFSKDILNIFMVWLCTA